MKKLILLILLPISCFSQNNAKLFPPGSILLIDTIKGSAKDIQTFFYSLKGSYPDSIGPLKISDRRGLPGLTFYNRDTIIADYYFGNHDNILTNEVPVRATFSFLDTIKRVYKLKITLTGDKMINLDIGNSGDNYRLSDGICIKAHLISRAFAVPSKERAKNNKKP